MTGRTSVIEREVSMPEMASPMTSRERVRCVLNHEEPGGVTIETAATPRSETPKYGRC
jgi:hypothetical protein